MWKVLLLMLRILRSKLSHVPVLSFPGHLRWQLEVERAWLADMDVSNDGRLEEVVKPLSIW